MLAFAGNSLENNLGARHPALWKQQHTMSTTCKFISEIPTNCLAGKIESCFCLVRAKTRLGEGFNLGFNWKLKIF